MYLKPTELESTFIEILNPKKTNVILGWIYCHLHIDLNKFNDYYVNNLVDNKPALLLVDFNQGSTIKIKSPCVITYVCQSFDVTDICGQIPESIYQASYLLNSDFPDKISLTLPLLK